MRTLAIREVQDGGVYLYRDRDGRERAVEVTDCETGRTSYTTSATRLFPVIST
jgi:hypothetical protein